MNKLEKIREVVNQIQRHCLLWATLLEEIVEDENEPPTVGPEGQQLGEDDNERR